MRKFLLVLQLFWLVLLAGCTSSWYFNPGAFPQIQAGMTKDQVASVLNAPQTVNATDNTEVCTYRVKDPNYFTETVNLTYIVTFVDGKVATSQRVDDPWATNASATETGVKQ